MLSSMICKRHPAPKGQDAVCSILLLFFFPSIVQRAPDSKQALKILLPQVADMVALGSLGIGKDIHIAPAVSSLKDALGLFDLHDSFRTDDDLMQREAFGVPQSIAPLFIGNSAVYKSMNLTASIQASGSCAIRATQEISSTHPGNRILSKILEASAAASSATVRQT